MRIGSSLFGVDLTAQHNLLQSFNQLNQSNLRLSTLKRINRGADDPAGLIASQKLLSELVSIEAAGQNTSRAVGIIHTADSAMGQVGGLLRDIRAGVVAASGNTMSDAEKQAVQIQVNAALEAINFIGNSTSLGGRKLLDGGGGFQVSGVNSEQVTDIQVHANAGGGEQALDLEVLAAATEATLTYTNAAGSLAEDVSLRITGSEGTATLEFSAGATLEQVAEAVNALSEQTGATAALDGTEISFSSTAVGSEASVSIEAIEGSFDVGPSTVAHGADVVINANGAEYTGSGNSVSISSETLQADVELAAGFVGQIDPITVSGGALRFAFSADPNNLSTLALPTVNTSALGGAAGRLSELSAGGSANLVSGDLGKAMEILDAAESQILEGRARAGAFEKYTIEASQNVLDSMEENLSAAQSAIADTDVAKEVSEWIRSQIMVQIDSNALQNAGNRRRDIASLFTNLVGANRGPIFGR